MAAPKLFIFSFYFPLCPSPWWTSTKGDEKVLALSLSPELRRGSWRWERKTKEISAQYLSPTHGYFTCA